MWWRFVIGGATTATPGTVLSPTGSKRSAEASGQATWTNGASARTLCYPGRGARQGLRFVTVASARLVCTCQPRDAALASRAPNVDHSPAEVYVKEVSLRFRAAQQPFTLPFRWSHPVGSQIIERPWPACRVALELSGKGQNASFRRG
jgi:hypothetical protein